MTQNSHHVCQRKKKKGVKIADLSKKSLSYTTVVGVDRKEGLLKGLSTLQEKNRGPFPNVKIG